MIEVIIEDGPHVLISIISHHFISGPIEYQATTNSILINLCYPNLTDYHWYKDIFLTNVLKREYNIDGLWKEWFVAGLPNLFGWRIITELRQSIATNNMPFHIHTFRALFGLLKNECLHLSNKFKLQLKYGSKRALSCRWIGNFYETFDIYQS